MLRIYRYLLYLYPAVHRAQFGDEMTAVFSDVQAETAKKRTVSRVLLCVREITGLLVGALHEHVRALGGVPVWLPFPTRRFTMRTEFRFPKSTAVLMTIILGGIILAMEKARVIQTSFSNGTPLVPLEAARLTFFPTVVLLLVIFYAAGLVGWAILFAMRRSGMHRLADISSQQK